jgi:hypothetical protein
MRTGQAVVAVPPVGLDDKHPGVQEAAEVGTGGGWGDTRFSSQAAGRKCPSVVEGHEYAATASISEDLGHGGDIGISVHGRQRRGSIFRWGPKC